MLSELFSTDDYNDILTGLQRTKAFVQVLRNYEDTFFEDGYRQQIDAYLDDLKAKGDFYEEDFDAVVTAFIETHELYTQCFLNAACGDTSQYNRWLQQVDSYDVATATLTLNSGAITVSQEVADVNLTDSDDNPTASHAIDIKIVGTYRIGNLTFVADHTYVDDNRTNDILSTTGMRVFFTTPVSVLADATTNPINGYQLRLADFQMYDSSRLDSADELEFDGDFALFYRGVKDPQDANSAIRFNIDTLVLDSRISNQVSDDDDDDNRFNTLDITATSAFASDYYPDKEFASFNGFFNTNSSAGFAKDSVANDLIRYQTGQETLGGDVVQYLDVRVPLGESSRYRLYPTIQRADTSDLDSDDDRDELVNLYDYEVCDLTGNHNDGWAVASCNPKIRLVGEADFNDFINVLWRSGVLSNIEVSGRGHYFVEWPATAGADSCLVLDNMPAAETSLNGTLYRPYVLGLNTLRFTSEVVLPDQPNTLLDVNVSAPTTDGYELTAALSHDYSSVSGSTVSLGSGSALDRIIVNYATDQNFENTGSLAVYKDGVSLNLGDGTTETVDSELELYLNASTGANPLPYQYVINNDGNYERCVLANVAEWDTDYQLEQSTFHLNYRDVVYGRLKQENGQWIIRYIDGTWETL